MKFRFVNSVHKMHEIVVNMKPNVRALTLPAIRMKMSPYYEFHLGIGQNMDNIVDCYVHDQRVWVHDLPKYVFDNSVNCQLLGTNIDLLGDSMLPHSHWSPISLSSKYFLASTN